MKFLKVDDETYEKIQEIRRSIALREGKRIGDDEVVKELLSRWIIDSTYNESTMESFDEACKGTNDPWAAGYAEVRSSKDEL